MPWARIISRGTVFLDFCVGLGVSERDFGPSLFEGGVGLEFEAPQWRGPVGLVEIQGLWGFCLG